MAQVYYSCYLFEIQWYLMRRRKVRRRPFNSKTNRKQCNDACLFLMGNRCTHLVGPEVSDFDNIYIVCIWNARARRCKVRQPFRT